MNWLLVSFVAQFILGSSGIFDKLLLQKKEINPYAYTFWLGILGFFSLFFLPFGFSSISLGVGLVAILAGFLFIIGLFFLYLALYRSEASRVIPLIGGISPLFTLGASVVFLNYSLGGGEIISFILLVAGGAVFYLVGEKKFRLAIIFYVLFSAGAFGLSNTLSKIVFDHTSFFTGFFWIKIGGVLLVLLSLFNAGFRKHIFASSKTSATAHKFWYLANRAYAGLGSILISFAVSLGHPALVDATQSLKYMVIFLAAWLILKERSFGKALLGKILATILIILGVLSLGLSEYAKSMEPVAGRPVEWNLTFSKKQSKFLGLDWRENLDAILKELKPSKIRLIAYWDEIEKTEGQYDFSDLDWQIMKAQEAGSKVILAIGLKVPRWPECHLPDWAASRPVEKREEVLRHYLQVAIKKYKYDLTIVALQIENEPYLNFGNCPARGQDFVNKEIALVKTIDAIRPVLVTDSGELGLWYKAVGSQGDFFGTTMYRKIYPAIVGPLTGIFEYPLPPSYFRLKEAFIRKITRQPIKKFIVIELQAEPWGVKSIPETPYTEQLKIFSPEYFSKTIEYAKAAGFDEYYFWGAEWWWMMKTKYNNPAYWDIAKKIINSQ